MFGRRSSGSLQWLSDSRRRGGRSRTDRGRRPSEPASKKKSGRRSPLLPSFQPPCEQLICASVCWVSAACQYCVGSRWKMSSPLSWKPSAHWERRYVWLNAYSKRVGRTGGVGVTGYFAKRKLYPQKHWFSEKRVTELDTQIRYSGALPVPHFSPSPRSLAAIKIKTHLEYRSFSVISVVSGLMTSPVPSRENLETAKIEGQ